MAYKKSFVPFRPYQGRKAKDTFIRLSKSMLLDKQFLDLSFSATKVYIYMLLWAAGREEVEYSFSIASKIVGSSATFNKIKKELIDKGFIKVTRTCKCSRQPNKFKFISDWSKQ